MRLNSQPKSLFKMTGPLISNDQKFTQQEASAAMLVLAAHAHHHQTTPLSS
jgi:hypothetical protein